MASKGKVAGEVMAVRKERNLQGSDLRCPEIGPLVWGSLMTPD